MPTASPINPEAEGRSASSPRLAATTMAGGLIKVPAITAVFWVIKILTTGMGEAGADFLTREWTIAVAAAVSGIALAVALWWQFHMPGYHALAYWIAVAMVAVFGTVASDVFNPYAGGPLNVPLPIVTAGYAIALAICFAVWYRTEGTLSIHSITTPRREGFYWVTVLLTFALGTAAGDWTAYYLQWGFPISIYVYGAAILVPLVLWRFAGLNAIVAFWIAYVLTRPLGASIADWLAIDKGFGPGPVALVAAILVAVLVVYLWRSRIDVQDRDEASRPTLAAR